MTVQDAENTPAMSNFAETVRERAGLANHAEAQQLCRATLQVLGQAISGGQAKQLARWLPSELGAELAAQHGQARALDKAQFLEKISAGIYTVDTDRVEQQATAVLTTTRDTAPAGQLDDTIAQLPPQLAALFGPTA